MAQPDSNETDNNMNIQEFASLFQTFKTSAFRLEALPQYLVDEERSEFAAFQSGRPLPKERNAEWASLIRDAVSAGKSMSRVHLLPRTLTPYLRFEIEWAYAYSHEAGEDVRLLLDEKATDTDRQLQDFWLFDDRIAIFMNYDDSGRFLGVTKADDRDLSRLLSVRETLLSRSIGLTEFLARARNAST